MPTQRSGPPILVKQRKKNTYPKPNTQQGEPSVSLRQSPRQSSFSQTSLQTLSNQTPPLTNLTLSQLSSRTLNLHNTLPIKYRKLILNILKDIKKHNRDLYIRLGYVYGSVNNNNMRELATNIFEEINNNSMSTLDETSISNNTRSVISVLTKTPQNTPQRIPPRTPTKASRTSPQKAPQPQRIPPPRTSSQKAQQPPRIPPPRTPASKKQSPPKTQKSAPRALIPPKLEFRGINPTKLNVTQGKQRTIGLNQPSGFKYPLESHFPKLENITKQGLNNFNRQIKRVLNKR